MPNRPPADLSVCQDWIQVLAAAYELEPEEVVRDAMLVASWQGSERGLRAAIRDRHGWHWSIPPYYVPALYSRLNPGP